MNRPMPRLPRWAVWRTADGDPDVMVFRGCLVAVCVLLVLFVTGVIKP